jgi:hypothetical protein
MGNNIFLNPQKIKDNLNPFNISISNEDNSDHDYTIYYIICTILVLFLMIYCISFYFLRGIACVLLNPQITEFDKYYLLIVR